MNILFAALPLFLGCSLLTACANLEAKTVEMESDNPAHCIAALLYFRDAALHVNNPNFELAVELSMRSSVEHSIHELAGNSREIKSETLDFLKAHSGDTQGLAQLGIKCIDKQNSS